MVPESKKSKILIVDDEEYNRDILNIHLGTGEYQLVNATNGLDAIEKLENNMPIDAILLDRMMPLLDGMQFLRTIKNIDKYRDIPVIIQSALGDTEQIVEGMEAGAFYYLARPYEKETLLAVLHSALAQSIIHRKTTSSLNSFKNTLQHIHTGSFNFRTLEEAKDISYAVSQIFGNSNKVVFGLNELTTNAVEHGNLNISFDLKKELLAKGQWIEEINRRLESPEYSEKFATLSFATKDGYHEISIKDMGQGFDFRKFMDFNPLRLTDPNGRGIAMAARYSFDEMKYVGKGNEVICRIKQQPAA